MVLGKPLLSNLQMSKPVYHCGIHIHSKKCLGVRRFLHNYAKACPKRNSKTTPKHCLRLVLFCFNHQKPHNFLIIGWVFLILPLHKLGYYTDTKCKQFCLLEFKSKVQVTCKYWHKFNYVHVLCSNANIYNSFYIYFFSLYTNLAINIMSFVCDEFLT